jgi:hypothetical protein
MTMHQHYINTRGRLARLTGLDTLLNTFGDIEDQAVALWRKPQGGRTHNNTGSSHNNNNQPYGPLPPELTDEILENMSRQGFDSDNTNNSGGLPTAASKW